MYNKSFNKVISLVAAVMLWIYVIGQINPATERKIEKIPINFINENIIDEEGLSVSRISHKYVDVVLEGKRSEINSISKSDIKVTANLKEAKRGNNNITLSIKTNKRVDVKQMTPESIGIKLEEKVTEAKSVKISYRGKFPKNKEPGETYINPRNIQVSGAKSYVNRVHHVEASVDVDKIKDTAKEIEAKVVPVDKNDNKVDMVGLSQNTVRVVAKMMEIKTVPLKVQTVGEIRGSLQLDKIKVPKKITIKGNSDVIKDIKEIIAKTVDISGVKKTTRIPVDANLPYSVALADESKNLEIQVILKKKSKGEITFNSSDIELRGLATGYTASVTQNTITAKITGNDKNLKNVGKSNIKLYVDLTDLKEGTHKVAIQGNYELNLDKVSFTPERVEVTIRKE